MHQFTFDLERSTLDLYCVIKNLQILRNEICDAFGGNDYLMECCDAMFSTLNELYRIHDEMDAAVEAKIKKGN